MDQVTPFLPQEIITNILICLPVKSLMRFHCVCKQWKTLIKSQSFISDHLYHSTHQTPSLLFQPKRLRKYLPLLHLLDHEMQVHDIPTIPLFNHSPFRIRGSCNGLLCVETHVKHKRFFTTAISLLLLCNPATRDVMMLPGRNKFRNMYLGFGFSSIVNDYKIVRMCVDYSRRIVRVEVYSLSTGSWRIIEGYDFIYNTRLIPNALIISGCMFWSGSNLEVVGGDCGVIVSFDIATEEFDLVPMPESGGMCHLMVYEDKLAIFDPGRDVEPGCVFDVWLMEEDEGMRSWSKIFSCDCSAFGFIVPALFWRGELVCNIDELPELGSEDEDGMNTVLSLLNIRTNEMKKRTTRRCGNGNAGIFRYAESLVPLQP